MVTAILDSSVGVTLLLRQDGYENLRVRLLSCSRLTASSLFVTEVLSVMRREGQNYAEADKLFKRVAILTPMDLRVEVEEVLSLGYLRGADTHHLATALWLAQKRRPELIFATFDLMQQERAKALGLGCF